MSSKISWLNKTTRGGVACFEADADLNLSFSQPQVTRLRLVEMRSVKSRRLDYHNCDHAAIWWLLADCIMISYLFDTRKPAGLLACSKDESRFVC